MSTPNPRLVSVPEAGEMLGVSRATAWRMVDAGTLPTVRVGRRRLVPVAAIDELVDHLRAA